MRAFKLVIEYDGTAFHGWQSQPRERTVQGAIEEALRAVLNDPAVTVAGAGRTDAGVHARGQVASFAAATTLPERALAPLLKRRLPGDVRVREAVEVQEGFHARHSARARRYSYHLLRRPDVMRERFAWWPRRDFDLDRLHRATQALEGEADFSAFRTSGSSPARPECRIFRAGWSATERGARLDIVADHFLYRMVRNIVGTALTASAEREPERHMREVLATRDRGSAGITAPAGGLCLEEVFYAATPETRS